MANVANQQGARRWVTGGVTVQRKPPYRLDANKYSGGCFNCARYCTIRKKLIALLGNKMITLGTGESFHPLTKKDLSSVSVEHYAEIKENWCELFWLGEHRRQLFCDRRIQRWWCEGVNLGNDQTVSTLDAKKTVLVRTKQVEAADDPPTFAHLQVVGAVAMGSLTT